MASPLRLWLNSSTTPAAHRLSHPPARLIPHRTNARARSPWLLAIAPVFSHYQLRPYSTKPLPSKGKGKVLRHDHRSSHAPSGPASAPTQALGLGTVLHLLQCTRSRIRTWFVGSTERAWWWWRAKQGMMFAAHFLNAMFFVHLVYAHIGRLSLTTGPSMLPTFATSGEIILEDRFSIRHLNAPLVRGDLLIVESPLQRGHMVCKRLLGLPGDVVCVDPTGECAPSTEHVRVPEGHVWISGDNAAWSRDSRHYGPVPMALVKGRIVARVWPPHKFTLYPSGSGITFLT